MRKIKLLALLLFVALAVTSVAGCGSEKDPGTSAPTAQNSAEEKPDVVTTASLVNEEAALIKAMSKDGTWIVCTLGDLKTDKELVIEGEFHNKNDASQDLYRKLGLYAQDENHNVTARYTLTAPKLTVKSPNTRIQGGTFVGDVYVENNGFNLSDAKIEGNVYFAKEEYKASFSLKEASVSGVTEVK